MVMLRVGGNIISMGEGNGLGWEVTFRVQGIPRSKKNAKRIFKNSAGTFFIGTDAKERKWESDCVLQIRSQFQDKTPYLGEIEGTFTLYLPDRRRRDCSNLVQAIEDALPKAGVIKDDSQIFRLIVEKVIESRTNLGALIHLKEYVRG